MSEIRLDSTKPCPDCRRVLTTEPKCYFCAERDQLRAELAAAKWLKESAADSYITDQQTSQLLLAAQALEALAWQAEKKATIQPYNGGWLCGTIDNSGHADTPLGAILAAMEGEKDGN